MFYLTINTEHEHTAIHETAEGMSEVQRENGNHQYANDTDALIAATPDMEEITYPVIFIVPEPLYEALVAVLENIEDTDDWSFGDTTAPFTAQVTGDLH